MRVDDLLIPKKELFAIDLLKENCAQFVFQSEGFPLLKNLPRSYEDFRKVKIRQRKGDEVSEDFNTAFKAKINKLRQRSLFAVGMNSLNESEKETEPFFVFPIDGYRFLYSTTIKNSKREYKTTFKDIKESLGSSKGGEMIKDVLHFSYVDNEQLSEGIKNGSEIIMYNIPFFYALRCSFLKERIGSYKKLWNLIK